MKDKFFGYYPPEEKEIEEIWNDSIMALDANTLLNLYRYTKSTKDDFLKILKEYSNRIWLPYQVGYEFHSNRINVIKTQEKTYNEIGKKLDEEFKNISEQVNFFKRHSLIKTDYILNQISETFDKIKSELELLSTNHPEYLINDDILPVITELFNGKIGDEFNETEYDKIYKEGETRYKKKIPPGYYDLSKKSEGDRHLYGDLIIWKQLINYSKKLKKTIIFITDDRKEDWWLKYKGETICPRVELIKEFFDETGFRILIYQADSFLRYANIRIKDLIEEKSINEITEVRLDDESKYVNLYKLQSDFGINNNENLRFNTATGIYINPLSNSNIEFLKNNNVFSLSNEKPPWIDSIDLISKISQKPAWMDNTNPILNLTQKPIWMDNINPILNLTQKPAWMDNTNPILNLTQKPAWMDNTNPILNLTQKPVWMDNTNPIIDLSQKQTLPNKESDSNFDSSNEAEIQEDK
jgi:hypothetical protein